MAEEGTEGAAANPETGDGEGAAANLEGQEQQQDQQQADTSWRDSIADEKVRKQMERFTDVPNLAKSYTELNAELSKRIKLPGEDATDEERAAFNKALGVPESVDEYKVTRPEFVDEETFNSDQWQQPIQSFVAEMHKAGATQGQVDAALGTYFNMVEAVQAQTAEQDAEYEKQAEADLRERWKGDYDANKAFAEQALAQFEYGAQLKDAELKTGTLLGSHPAFIEMMAEVGRLKSEGQLQAGMRGSEGGADLQKQYDDLSEQIYAAQDKGDMAAAQRIDAERSKISEKLFGTGPIPGRAA